MSIPFPGASTAARYALPRGGQLARLPACALGVLRPKCTALARHGTGPGQSSFSTLRTSPQCSLARRFLQLQIVGPEARIRSNCCLWRELVQPSPRAPCWMHIAWRMWWPLAPLEPHRESRRFAWGALYPTRLRGGATPWASHLLHSRGPGVSQPPPGRRVRRRDAWIAGCAWPRRPWRAGGAEGSPLRLTPRLQRSSSSGTLRCGGFWPTWRPGPTSDAGPAVLAGHGGEHSGPRQPEKAGEHAGGVLQGQLGVVLARSGGAQWGKQGGGALRALPSPWADLVQL